MGIKGLIFAVWVFLPACATTTNLKLVSMESLQAPRFLVAGIDEGPAELVSAYKVRIETDFDLIKWNRRHGLLPYAVVSSCGASQNPWDAQWPGRLRKVDQEGNSYLFDFYIPNSHKVVISALEEGSDLCVDVSRIGMGLPLLQPRLRGNSEKLPISAID